MFSSCFNLSKSVLYVSLPLLRFIREGRAVLEQSSVRWMLGVCTPRDLQPSLLVTDGHLFQPAVGARRTPAGRRWRCQQPPPPPTPMLSVLITITPSPRLICYHSIHETREHDLAHTARTVIIHAARKRIIHFCGSLFQHRMTVVT